MQHGRLTGPAAAGDCLRKAAGLIPATALAFDAEFWMLDPRDAAFRVN